jgi:NhaA family Na+:H+ antiporter
MIRTVSQSAVDALKTFLRLESAAGVLLTGAAVLAVILANSPLSWLYELGLRETHLVVTLGDAGVDKPLLLWINDGLMAVFFLLVGLELKREVVEGQLSSPAQVILPSLAALGGLAVPAGIFWLINRGDAVAMGGWAIPMATDIAFALAVLMLLGSRVPVALKVFLTTIAIVDDLAAIIVIAVFYTNQLSVLSLGLAGLGIVVLLALNRAGVQRLAAYLITGVFIWICVLKSGVHATLAGVVLAAFIPLRTDDDSSPARHLEHILHPWVALAILPIFAFANAGIALRDISMDMLTGGISLGIIAGLFLGKQLGVFGMVVLARVTGLAQLPEGTTWAQIYGIALICGIGFTMSLFIGSLAYEHVDFNQDAAVKLGVICGSLLSAFGGWLVLHLSLPKTRSG